MNIAFGGRYSIQLSYGCVAERNHTHVLCRRPWRFGAYAAMVGIGWPPAQPVIRLGYELLIFSNMVLRGAESRP